MTAARAERPGLIPARTWPSQGLHAMRSHLVAGATAPGDYGVLLAVQQDDRTAGGAVLTADQLRELAADLMDRADALDNLAGRNRRTPNEHIRLGDRFLARADREDAPEWTSARAAQAAAHYQAALAKKSISTVHITHHHPS
ncbi:hypothetical protein [Saccharothrix sp. HUAS TT1]|uniref:hypothetical protein n=1 Tax=unclassified Saccharothrix TaxID=2593673 RepID=UPI00345C0323